jgi:hypothetical protein
MDYSAYEFTSSAYGTFSSRRRKVKEMVWW